MNNVFASILVGKELYSSLLSPVCTKYNLSNSEVMTLLFLANNPQFDTASDIVKQLRFTKSRVSMLVRNLEDRGYLSGNFEGCNHRSIHLKICDPAEEIVKEGRAAQEKFISIIREGFSDDEEQIIQDMFAKALDNMVSYLSSK